MRSNQIEVPDLNLDFNDPEPEKNIFIAKYQYQNDKSESSNSNGKKNQKKNKNKKCIYIVNVRNIDNNLKVKEINKIFTELQQSYQKFYSKEG